METEVGQGAARPGALPQALLRLYLLGRFEVVRADAPVPAHAWRRRRPADLLKLVALAPGRALSREKVVDTLWPDKDPASGANNLHRALYDLRQILGGRWVDLERGQVRLRADVWLDVDAFEAAVARGEREGFTQAVALYRGDLCPEDEDFPGIQARRAALRARFAEAALPLARTAAAEGDAQLAVPLLRRVLEVERTAEDAHRLLIRLLAESGRRAEALRQFDACELALREIGLAPSDETRQLRAAIQAGELGPLRTRAPQDGARRAARRLLGTTDPPPVRGRGPLVLLLESLLEQGSGALVLLGERGVGKTRLAVEGARLAQGAGAAVLCGIGGTAPGVPYGLFQDVLREEARANPAVVDPFAGRSFAAGVAGERVRLAIFQAVEDALRAAADGRPLYLLLDDLHLADESSLNLVHLLARRARELHLMIVGTCSEQAVRAGTAIQTALAHLDCGRLARGVRVPRLGLAGTREQVVDLAGPLDEGTLARIYRVTDGSPLAVEEVVRAYREAGGALVPPDAASAIRTRVARLGEGAERVLAAAAVAGPRFDFEPVRLVSGLTAHEAVAALEACLSAHLVDGDGTSYRFHGGIVQEALCDGLAPERRAALNAAMGDALEAHAAEGEVPPEVLARHRRRAGQDARAVRHLVTAGHRAAARAGLREAYAFYVDALALAGEADPSRQELLDAVGRVQLGLGEVSGAARAFQHAAHLAEAGAQRPDPLVRATAHRLAALSLAAGGLLRAAHAEIDEGLAASEELGGDGAGPLLLLRATIFLHEGRLREARDTAQAAAVAAGGDQDLAAQAEELAALARAALGVPAAETPPFPEPRTGDADPERLANVHLFLWDRDLVACEQDTAAVGRLARILAERERTRGTPGGEGAGRTGEGAAALAAGKLDLAEAILGDALRAHRAAGSALGEALVLERTAALLTMRGRLDEALALLDEGVVAAERATLRCHALTRLHATEARNRLAAGALYAAEDAAREASEIAARHGECVACDALFRPEAVRVLLARGRIAEADREAAQLEELARRRAGRVLGAFAQTARARVLAAQGARDSALEALELARVAFLDAGHRYEAARCARLELRLLGPGASVSDELRALDALVTVDADA